MGMKDQFQDKAEQLKQQAKGKLGQERDEPSERSPQERERMQRERMQRERGQQDPSREQRDAQERLDEDYDV